MKLRPASPADIEAIAALHTQSWRTAYRGMLSDAYLDGDIAAERSAVWKERFRLPRGTQHVAVAEDGTDMIGFACAYANDNAQWGTLLENLHVAPGKKRQGIGALLLAEVASWSSAVAPRSGLFLWVLEQNHAARRFYEKLGAANTGEDIWCAPDGSAVKQLRYAWKDAASLCTQL